MIDDDEEEDDICQVCGQARVECWYADGTRLCVKCADEAEEE